MITRQDILEQAVHKCLVEMYKWAQPSIDIDKLIKSGYKDTRENPLYERHYLSYDNYKYIVDRFIEAYGMTDKWDDIFDLIYKYLIEGGIKDKYIQPKDAPGYRGYEDVPSLYKYIDEEDADIALSLIYECQHFYNHGQDASRFGMTMALGVGSPNSNKEVVEKYWKQHGYADFKIEDFEIDNVLYSDEISSEDFIQKLINKTPNIYGL